MGFVPITDLIGPAARDGYAVPSFCVWSGETIQMVLAAAERLRSPVILMGGPSEFTVLRPAQIADIARAMLPRFNVPAALHLDHANSLDLVAECIEAGYTSVMLDLSTQPFDRNVAGLRQAVAMARPRGISVEGELGHVGRADAVSAESADGSTLTDPGAADDYVAQTGVDSLAVSIGNAHGQYTRLPQFDFECLAAIRKAVAVPLVLHGGSGTPQANLKRAISMGIAKVNVATELIAAIRGSLLAQWQAGRNLWVPMAQPEALAAAAQVVERWIRQTGAAGRA